MFKGPPPCPEFLSPPRPGAVLRPTIWGHCHWVWRGETIGDSVRDWGSFGPVAEVTSALRRLGPSAHLVDVGTNVGLVSAAAMALGHNVTCFEAEPHNVALWRATLALNNWTARATIVDRAVVANSTAELSVGFRRWDARNRGGSRIMRGTKSLHVPTTHLDLWASQLPRGAPVVMKLDIEGCEHGALLGARREMLRHVHAVFTEISPRAMAACGGNAIKYVKLLQRHGFRVVRRHGEEGALHADIRDAQTNGRLIDAAFWRPAASATMAVRGALSQMLSRWG